MASGSTVTAEIRNEREIVLFALQRSGHHAIIDWLIGLLGPRVAHLNDVGGASPYDSCREITVKGFPLWSCKRELRALRGLFAGRSRLVEYSKKDERVDWRFIRAFAPKDALILSYENASLEAAHYLAFQRDHDPQVGRSREHHRVVVLRDAYNLFASLHRSAFVDAAGMQRCIELYKAYGRLFLDARRGNAIDTVCISYNEWVASADYRMQIAQRFGLECDGRPFLAVPSIGGGSTFEGMRNDGRADRMKVFERWRRCWDDPAYRAIVDDDELVTISDEIFGSVVPEAWLGQA